MRKGAVRMMCVLIIGMLLLTGCCSHEWQDATCTVPQTCALCGNTKGESTADHMWKQATCMVPRTCSLCGTTQGEPSDHKWQKATCAAPQTCAVCGSTQGKPLFDHSWKEATCDSPKTCAICKLTEGTALGHDYQSGVCTKPETCTVCGKESGNMNTYLEYNDFSEGLAWVKFYNSTGNYWGCIDKTGKIVFQYPSDTVTLVVPFSNGYAYIHYEDALKIIDKTGKICSSYTIDKNNRVVAYGDGYAFIENCKADFDSAIYIYSICDSNGTVLESFTQTKNDYVFFDFGKGVFGYRTISSWKWDIYFSKSGKWINYDLGPYQVFYFEDNTALLDIESGKTHDYPDGYTGRLKIVDLEGNITDVLVPKDCGSSWASNSQGIDMAQGICVLYEADRGISSLVSYNHSNGKCARLSDEYSEKVWYGELENVLFENGYIALPLQGADGGLYVSLFDTEWNMTFSPIQIDKDSPHSLSGDRLIVKIDSEIFVYDIKGNVVFSSSDVNCTGITLYADGVARVANRNVPTYLDAFGKLLF